MFRFRRVIFTILTAFALILALSSTAMAAGGASGGGQNSGGSASGGGSSTGGGGSSTGGGGSSTGGGSSSGGGGSSATAPCGAITLNTPTFTTYYQYFTGTATNCEATTMDYVVVLSDLSVHTDPLCTMPSTSNKKAPIAPETIGLSWFKPLPCYDDYTIRAELTLNRQVAATTTISFTYTPTGIIMH